MAESEGSSGGASQLPKSEATTTTIKLSKRIPRRQLTLVAITACLHVLLWSSIFTLVTTLYLIASDTSDATNVPTEVLTITSASVSIGYIVLHTIFSLKQKIWKHQGRHPSILKKTSYFAIRVAVTLCVLWLLTSGWNMIVVARRPVCLPDTPGFQGWEAGTTCVVGRAGVAISLIALLASCTLFGMLAVVRRPFEAHLLKNGYRKPVDRHPTPAVSRRPSPSRSASFTSEKLIRGRVSASTHRSTSSNVSNADVETIDLDQSPPGSTIHAPSPIRSIGLGIFTSHGQPPPLPAAFLPRRSTSLDTLPPVFHPSTSHQILPPPPRMSSLVAPSGFVPLSIPVQYAASTWKAVHPPLPSPLGPAASRSYSHLPSTSQGYNFSYRSRYSRSSISLTRPHRLSTATPAGSVGWTSRSSSTGPAHEGRRTPASSSESMHERRPSANAIAYAILNGTTIPGTAAPRQHRGSHIRQSSAPDATMSAQEYDRKAKGWKPTLRNQDHQAESLPIHIPRSSSADLLSKFSPDSSPEDNNVSMRTQFEMDLELRLSLIKALPIRKSQSASPLRHSDIAVGATNATRSSSRTQTRRNSTNARHTDDTVAGAQSNRMTFEKTFEEIKNKPLPKIAAL
ncbi:hypothetical protein BDV96DRAFT_654610 [Lophiotrema nucula]|uniref:Uncharacterized protein n=1 Tax=Lophiotrema nucula TaxID=690887 RepID=A0A6A5YKC2_9PLEO|nr:hypothetical protein BDV96DRAFT_654610 [Lophiotrema nucula]